jgi:glycerophosphoryl diester phosphodiesterase
MLLDWIIKGRTGHPLWPKLKSWRYAHRGYHDKPQIPENSLPAFRRAIERGWGAELDVHLLSDGTLAVFHDSGLKRCTGQEGILEDLTFDQMKTLRLEGTEEQIPTFDEVLALFEGRAPLIIELKTYKGNHRALVEAVCRRLDRYCSLFCIESFDPRAVADVRDLRPAICRGQLASDFLKDPEDLPLYQRVILTNLLLDVKARPDFIAYKFEDRNVRANRRAVDKLGLQEVCWTIRSKEDLQTVESAGAIPIFETFDPES